jgi:exoribonuclease-2
MIFRSQANPDEIDYEADVDIKKIPPFLADYLKLFEMNAAVNSAEPKTHYAIGLDLYSRVTSPIRRYSDIICHYNLKSHLKQKELPFSSKLLSQILPQMKQTEREIKELQRNSERLYLRHWLNQNRDKIFQAYVLSVQLKGVEYEARIIVPALGLVSFASLVDSVEIGMQINVIADIITPFFLRFHQIRDKTPFSLS